MSFRLRHLLLALLLHLVAFGLMSVGVSCQRKIEPPTVVRAVLLDPSRQEVEKRERAEEQRRLEAQRRREAEERRRQAEAEERRHAEEQARQQEQERKAREQREAELQRKAEAERQAAAAKAERERKQQEENRRKQEAEARAAEKREAERRAAEKREAERRAAEERHRQEMIERERQEQLQQQLAREEEARRASERSEALAQWKSAIEDRIRRNWLRPPNTAENFQCTVRVEQLPGGQIVSRSIVQSCGSPLLDESVLRAVDKSDPLPIVPNPSAFERVLIVNFTPMP